MQRLTGKVAIVTGASAGIGRETARLFANEGAKLVVAARRESELETLTREIVSEGGKAEYLAGDVRSEEFAKALVELAINCFGRLDIACNNVGILGEVDPTFSASETGWTNSMEANLTSAFFGAKYQIPEMLKQGGGSIFFLATFVDRSFAFLGGAAYVAGNFGLIGLTRALVAEYGAQGMRVNAFLPDTVDAQVCRVLNKTANSRTFSTSLHALERFTKPDKVARSMLNLACVAQATGIPSSELHEIIFSDESKYSSTLNAMSFDQWVRTWYDEGVEAEFIHSPYYPDATTLEHLRGYFEAGLSPAEAARVCFARKH